MPNNNILLIKLIKKINKREQTKNLSVDSFVVFVEKLSSSLLFILMEKCFFFSF